MRERQAAEADHQAGDLDAFLPCHRVADVLSVRLLLIDKHQHRVLELLVRVSVDPLQNLGVSVLEAHLTDVKLFLQLGAHVVSSVVWAHDNPSGRARWCHNAPLSEPVREQWGSRLGFAMAAIGSAVGLGNMWRFSYLTAENGGAAFVLLYVGFTLVIGLPVLRRRKSSFIHGIEDDATDLCAHLCDYLGA